jgi:ABC-type oligopeptide transport system substrate-binding subunit
MRRILAGLAALVLIPALGAARGAPGTHVRPRDGGLGDTTLRVGVTAPGSVDPANAYEPVSRLITSTMCTPLVRLDPRTGEPRPGIATRWVVTDGGRRITLRLRKDARFPSGRHVRADDVVFSLSRAASADVAGITASQLASVDGYEFVHGDRDTRDAAKRRRLAGVRAILPTSVELTLHRRQGDFVRALSLPIASVLDRRAAARDPLGRAPVCAGPYRLAHPFTPGDRTVRLRRASGRGPAVIEFSVYDADALALAAFERGEVDVAPVPADGFAAAIGALGPDLRTVAGPHLEYIGVPGVPANVRRALSAALDRRVIAADVFGGSRLPARAFVPPAAGRVARGAPCAELPARGDVARARALLGGERPDVPIPLLYNDELGNRALVDTVAAQWRDALGIAVVPTPTPWSEMLRTAASPGGFGGFFRMGWTPSYPGPDGYLGAPFTSAGIGEANFARSVDARYDDLLDRRARGTGDAAEQRLAYRAVEDRLCRRMPMIPVTLSRARWAIRSARVRVAGPPLERATGLPRLTVMTVAP